MSDKQRLIYPEVTGYFIPTLISWGQLNLALKYAKWLCRIQKDDGLWFDFNDKAPYVFVSAQILKGLLAIREYDKSVDDYIIRGCDWIISNIQESGRLTSPNYEQWGKKGALN